MAEVVKGLSPWFISAIIFCNNVPRSYSILLRRDATSNPSSHLAVDDVIRTRSSRNLILGEKPGDTNILIKVVVRKCGNAGEMKRASL